MKDYPRKVILGQECICPDGLGRVIDYDLNMPNNYIQVETYVNNRGCKWDQDNVELINPRRATE